MELFVYAGWLDNNPLIGKIYCEKNKTQEVFSFEYDKNWLKNNVFDIDPEVFNYQGRQYSNDRIFGFILDCLPDRWGRTLLDRNENIVSKIENRSPKKLTDIDYLLRTNDRLRTGALRFKLEENGEYICEKSIYSIPPFTSLRELEDASLNLEKTGNFDKYLKELLSPGSSLGGARPKASIVDTNGELWIAKFPSKNDEYDVGAFEMLAHDLAVMCKLNVSEAKLMKFSNYGSTFITKRFDRDHDKRIHFVSAMTLLNKKDGETSSYLELADFIRENSGKPKDDLKELFRRLVFNMVISNSDDHLRNHGFVLVKNKWILSPAYDINPNPTRNYLTLNINENDSLISFETLNEISKYFGLTKDETGNIIKEIKGTVKDNWLKLANKYKINREDIEYMKNAFKTE